MRETLFAVHVIQKVLSLCFLTINILISIFISLGLMLFSQIFSESFNSNQNAHGYLAMPSADIVCSILIMKLKSHKCSLYITLPVSKLSATIYKISLRLSKMFSPTKFMLLSVFIQFIAKMILQEVKKINTDHGINTNVQKI